VAAEEADWLLCDAYRKWRLLRTAPPLEVFDASPKGTILSEGAGAVLLSRNGAFELAAISSGGHFANRRGARSSLSSVLKQVHATGDVVISSANGTFIDAAEASAVSEVLPLAQIYGPKGALGEGVAASGLWQVIVAVQGLRTQKLPWAIRARSNEKAGPIKLCDVRGINILCCGLNQQVGAAHLISAG
jgi:3-oxoacyl-(acyl-carrier-protein) synthase